jgi:hypothetical protein
MMKFNVMDVCTVDVDDTSRITNATVSTASSNRLYLLERHSFDMIFTYI